MRVSKVEKLSYLRNFIDFKSSIELDKKVVIYAPNGSGKTNLSRLFYYLKVPYLNIDALKSQEKEAETEKVRFKIHIDGQELNESNYSEGVRQELLNTLLVFNCDFVDKQINCEDFSDKDTDGSVQIELGAEDNELKDAREKHQKLVDKRLEACRLLTDTLDGVKDRLILEERRYSGNETNIWNELSINKVLIPNVFKQNDIHVNFLKSDSQLSLYETCEADLKQTKGMDSSDKVVFNQSLQYTVDLDEIFELLDLSVTIPETDTEIESNLNFLKNWLSSDLLAMGRNENDVIKKGIEVSEHVGKCVLCKRTLDKNTKDLFELYKAHFKGEKAKYEAKINDYIRSLNNLGELLGQLDNSLEQPLNKYAELFDIKERWTNIDTLTSQTDIGSLVEALGEKIKDPSKKISPILALSENLEALKVKIDHNEKLCIKVNRKIEHAKQRSSDLRRQVGQKYLYEFMNNNVKNFEQLEVINGQIVNSLADIREKEKAAPTSSSRDHVKNLFNIFLNEKIGISKYEADVIDEQIIIKLNSVNISKETNKISEGEKTMIGLCYFFASSIFTLDTKEKLEKSVFIIDDPVSSTSYSNFFGISDLIQGFEKVIKREIWPSYKRDLSIQKIVLTHNIQFFNMLRSHVFKPAKSNNTKYLILQNDSFKEMGKKGLLSEFQTSLWRIYKKSQDASYDTNIGNDMRRVLETLRHFYGLKEFNQDTILRIFPYTDDLGHKDFFQLVNYYSHGNAEEGLDPLPPELMDKGVQQFVELISHRDSSFSSLWSNMIETEGLAE